jgi:hypothetical protein
MSSGHAIEPKPLPNRCDPFGRLHAVTERGSLMGYRGGRFHTSERGLGKRRYASKRWICCICDFKGRQRTVWGEGYTELFFLDEVTALAAGHRPCFECRSAEAKDFARRFGRPCRQSRCYGSDPARGTHRWLERRPATGRSGFTSRRGDDCFSGPGPCSRFERNPAMEFQRVRARCSAARPAGGAIDTSLHCQRVAKRIPAAMAFERGIATLRDRDLQGTHDKLRAQAACRYFNAALLTGPAMPPLRMLPASTSRRPAASPRSGAASSGRSAPGNL